MRVPQCRTTRGRTPAPANCSSRFLDYSLDVQELAAVGTIYASFTRRRSAQIVDWLLCPLPAAALVVGVFVGFVALESSTSGDVLIPLWLLSEVTPPSSRPSGLVTG